MLKDKLKDNIFIATVIAFGTIAFCIAKVHGLILYVGMITPIVTASSKRKQKHKAFLNIAYFCNFAGAAIILNLRTVYFIRCNPFSYRF